LARRITKVKKEILISYLHVKGIICDLLTAVESNIPGKFDVILTVHRR